MLWVWASDSQHAAVRPVVGSAKVLIPNHLWERKGGRRDGGGGERRVGARSLSPSFSLSLDFSLIFSLSLSRSTKHSADIYTCVDQTQDKSFLMDFSRLFVPVVSICLMWSLIYVIITSVFCLSSPLVWFHFPHFLPSKILNFSVCMSIKLNVIYKGFL